MICEKIDLIVIVIDITVIIDKKKYIRIYFVIIINYYCYRLMCYMSISKKKRKKEWDRFSEQNIVYHPYFCSSSHFCIKVKSFY